MGDARMYASRIIDSAASPGLRRRLKADSIGWIPVLVFAFASASPINGLCGAAPAALQHRGGTGLALALLLVGGTQVLFAAAVAPLLRRVVDAGGWYACIARCLSRRAGLAAAALSLAAYQSLQLAGYAMLGAFLSECEQRLWGQSLPWWFNALLVNAVVPFCSQRGVSFGARLLGLLGVVQLLLMLAFAAAVLLRGGGAHGLNLAPLAPAQAFAPGFGVALAFAVACYAGFETAAMYGEEARDPRRAVPRALIAAAALATLCLTASVWALLVVYGQSSATAPNPVALWSFAASRPAPAGVAAAMDLILLGALFAGLIGFQSASARCLFALGRDGAVWPALAQVHPLRETPYIANLAQASVSILALAAFGLFEDNPMQIVLGASSGFAAMALLCVQILACAAAWRWLRASSAPKAARIGAAVSALALTALLAAVAWHLPQLSGGRGGAALAIAACALLALLGALRGQAMKHGAPAAYAALGRVR